MGHYERLWLEKYTGTQVLYYRRYVDDIICCFQNSHDADMFFTLLTFEYLHNYYMQLFKFYNE